jgi:hypothetical protein
MAKTGRDRGGNSHQRAMAKAVQTPEDVDSTSAPEPVVVIDRRTRFIKFLEHPWVLLVFGVLGGIVGLIYTPVLFISVLCILGAFHRSSVVKGLKWTVQILSYLGVAYVSSLLIYISIFIIRKEAQTSLDNITQAIAQTLRQKPSSPDSVPAPPPSNLHLSIEGISAGPVQGPDGKTTGSVFVVVKVSNFGSPTTVHQWRLKTILPDGSMSVDYPIHLRPKDTISFKDRNNRTQSVTGMDAIYEKVAVTPIPKEDSKVGILLFAVNFSVKNLQTPGTTYILQCLDPQDQILSVTHTFLNESGTGGTLVYVPGLSTYENEPSSDNSDKPCDTTLKDPSSSNKYCFNGVDTHDKHAALDETPPEAKPQ